MRGDVYDPGPERLLPTRGERAVRRMPVQEQNAYAAVRRRALEGDPEGGAHRSPRYTVYYPLPYSVAVL